MDWRSDEQKRLDALLDEIAATMGPDFAERVRDAFYDVQAEHSCVQF